METKTATTEYYVGDLAYVMHDAWSEVCDLIPFDNSESQFTLEDGRTFFLLGTSYGDGTYTDQLGREYSVDSGTLGAIKVSDIRDPEFDIESVKRLGQIIPMPYELDEHDCFADDGALAFGPVVIDTDPYFEDEIDFEDDETDENF